MGLTRIHIDYFDTTLPTLVFELSEKLSQSTIIQVVFKRELTAFFCINGHISPMGIKKARIF